MPQDEEREKLALFQSRLMQLLWEEAAPAKIREALLADEALAPFHDYVASMEDRMIAVAAELAHKWGSAKLDVQGD